jgi:hypothetical protein
MNKEVAIELRRRLQIKGALRLDDIAKPLGLSMREVDSDGFDGALVRRSSGVGGRILVKRNIRERTRKRFTAAHEIGHYLLHRDSDSLSCGSQDIANWTNVEANPEHEVRFGAFAPERGDEVAHWNTMAVAQTREQSRCGV